MALNDFRVDPEYCASVLTDTIDCKAISKASGGRFTPAQATLMATLLEQSFVDFPFDQLPAHYNPSNWEHIYEIIKQFKAFGHLICWDNDPHKPKPVIAPAPIYKKVQRVQKSRPPIPDEIRRAVFERDGYQCVKCGDRYKIACDHIHPYSKGGADTLENLRVLCKSCNSRKGARIEAPEASTNGSTDH
jgi:hypothetical protein